MLKKIVKIPMHFPEKCIFVIVVTFGLRQLQEQPKYCDHLNNIKIVLQSSSTMVIFPVVIQFKQYNIH